MKIKLYILLLLFIVTNTLYAQEYLVCKVSGEPANVKYQDGKVVNEGDILNSDNVLTLDKYAKILFINRENKEVSVCHGEGVFTVGELVKSDNSRRTSEFFKFVRDLWLGRVKIDLSGVIYRDNPELEALLAGCIDSTGVRGLELGFADSEGAPIEPDKIGLGQTFYFVVKNNSEYPLFINILKKERNGELKNCCICDEMQARLDLVVPGKSEVLISGFPQTAGEKQVGGFIVLGSDKFTDAESVIYSYVDNRKFSKKDLSNKYNYFYCNN